MKQLPWSAIISFYKCCGLMKYSQLELEHTIPIISTCQISPSNTFSCRISPMDSKEGCLSGRLATRGKTKRPVDIVSTKHKSFDTGSSHGRNKKDSKRQGGKSNTGAYVGATVNATEHLAVFYYQPKCSADNSDVVGQPR